MNALQKTTSRLAMAAAASLFASGAYAADLGGNCCSDLEERVAELEATTARKGNRKVSLTVYGQVNEAVMLWDDSVERNAYVVTNDQSRSRFGFRGDAKINAEWSAGYLLEIGVRSSNSTSINQLNDDVSGGGVAALDLRHSAWWIENKRLGRVWVGQTSTASDGITEINLSNSGTLAGNDFKGNPPTGFGIRLSNGQLAQNNTSATAGGLLTWGNTASNWNGNPGEGDRRNTVRYITPTFQGFTASAAWGEDDFWDVALRYANEFNGVRIAAGIGYQWYGDREPGCQRTTAYTVAAGATTTVGVTDVDCEALGLSGSVMHVPTGLFVSAAYGYIDDNNRTRYLGAGAKSKDEHWYIVAGIEKNFFGIGKTTLFGEFGQYDTGTNGSTCGSAAGTCNIFGAAALGTNTLVSSDISVWGIGMVQSIDAAAMDLYIGYRQIEGDSRWVAGGAVGAGVAGTNVSHQDFSLVTMGGIIRF